MRGLQSCIGLIQTTGRGLFVLLVLLLLPSAASAADYYWKYQASSPDYSSASLACDGALNLRQDQVNALSEPSRSYYSPVIIREFTKLSDTQFKCVIQSGAELNYNWNQYTIDRYGDSCPAEHTYNTQTGECEGAEPDQCEPTVGQVVYHEFHFKSLDQDGNPSTDPPVTVCKNSCQYSHTFGKFNSKRDFGPPDEQVGFFEYKGNGVSCTASTTDPSGFNEPPSKDPVDNPPAFSSDNSCSGWQTQPDGTLKRSCTANTSYTDEGEVQCEGGTSGSAFTSSVICTPSKTNPPEKTDTSVTQDTEKKTNPDGSTDTTTTTDTTKTNCKGLSPCTSTEKSETSSETADSNGNTTSATDSCTGAGCNPENPNEEPTEEEEGVESAVSGDSVCDSTPSCEGDAIQCAILRQTHKSRCNQEEFQSLEADKVAEAESTLSSEFAGDQYSPLTPGSEGTFNLAGMLDTSSSIGGGCPVLPDISFTINGQTKSVSLSQWLGELCKYAVWFSYLLVAFAMRAAAEVVAGGFK